MSGVLSCTYPEAVHLASTGDPETACCIGDFRVPGLKKGAWETMCKRRRFALRLGSLLA